MVRIGQGFLCEFPGFLPAEMRFIEQNSHQFWDRQCWVRVIELNSNLVWECAPIVVRAPETSHQVGQRGGDQEIFLHEAKCLSPAGRVIWIENPGDGFGGESLSQCGDEIATTEFLKVKVTRSGRSPEAQRINGLAAVTDNWPIIRNTSQT